MQTYKKAAPALARRNGIRKTTYGNFNTNKEEVKGEKHSYYPAYTG